MKIITVDAVDVRKRKGGGNEQKSKFETKRCYIRLEEKTSNIDTQFRQ